METLSPPNTRWRAGSASLRSLEESGQHAYQDPVFTNRPHERNRISLPRLLQRLSLLASLELPCAIQTLETAEATGSRSGRLRSCGCSGGRFWLSLDTYTLQLYEADIASVRLRANVVDGRRQTSIDLVSASGGILARLRNAPDPLAAAVWQDIMDTFDCA